MTPLAIRIPVAKSRLGLLIEVAQGRLIYPLPSTSGVDCDYCRNRSTSGEKAEDYLAASELTKGNLFPLVFKVHQIRVELDPAFSNRLALFDSVARIDK